MSHRVRIKDIAARASVSVATVDRVINGRGGYSAASVARVREAIEALGYGGLPPHLTTVRKKIYRFKMFLPALNCHFRRSIEAQANNAISRLSGAEVKLSVNYVSLEGGRCTIDALRNVDPDTCHGVCLFAVDAPGVREEIDRLSGAGVKVCTIVSDVPSSRRLAYIGLDNVAAGRTAGRMIGRMLTGVTGSVGVVTGSNQIRDHIERFMGFSQGLMLHNPQLRLLNAREGDSYPERNSRIVQDIVSENDDLRAIYSIGGGSAGVIDGVRASGKSSDLFVLVHELEPAVREGLLDGTVDMVLHQNTEDMMRKALDAMMHGVEPGCGGSVGLRTEIYVAENLP